jgi:putative transposase
VGDVHQGAPEWDGCGGLFTVEVPSPLGLVRYHVLFVIELATRKVEIAGMSGGPDGLWMDQMARNLLDAADLFLRGKRYLILDRDPQYTKEFRAMLRRGGVKVIRLPPSSPNLNAYAERFVPSIRRECLDRSCRWARRTCDGRCVNSCSTIGSSGTTRGSGT